MVNGPDEIYDITVIGGGPAGLYGLYYAGLRGMKAKVIESLPQLGGQPAALYPEKYIYDVAGFPRVLGKDLAANLEEQALRHNPTVCLGERVASMQREDGLIVLATDKGRHLTRTVLIAAGAGAFAPRKVAVPRLEEMEGRGVYYFVRDREAFRGKAVMIVGGGDSAVDWALALQDIAARVILVHRRDGFRAHEQAVREVYASGRVEVLVYHEVKALAGEERVEGVTVFDNRSGEERAYDVDTLLLNIGFLSDLGPIRSWGLDFARNAISVSASMATNLPGVYAAGDIASHPGHLKLISVGAAEAAVAVNNAKHFLDPEAAVEPGHSTHLVPALAAAA